MMNKIQQIDPPPVYCIVSHALLLYGDILASFGAEAAENRNDAAPCAQMPSPFFFPSLMHGPNSEPGCLCDTYGLVGNPPGVSRQDLGRCGGKEKPFTAIQDRTKGLSAQSVCQRVRYLRVWWTAGFWGTPPTHLSAVPALTGGEPRTMVCT